MAVNKTEIYVYADWVGLLHPTLIGVLTAHQAKGRKAFSFEYDKHWLKTKEQRLIDPDIQFYSGQQFPDNKENFYCFLLGLCYKASQLFIGAFQSLPKFRLYCSISFC